MNFYFFIFFICYDSWFIYLKYKLIFLLQHECSINAHHFISFIPSKLSKYFLIYLILFQSFIIYALVKIVLFIKIRNIVYLSLFLFFSKSTCSNYLLKYPSYFSNITSINDLTPFIPYFYFFQLITSSLHTLF